ncbi:MULTISPECIES: site-specific DNA-methyltransferase [unclassified Haloarcula]|uniref:site-specific DNA-methyltransferase n=1 Tax=unclassified Haloarcula TaxID=2624677 RepID=UPI00177F0094|nr:MULTISPECIES: site-specific DNA-methyltransferase [unclassified Haloarcula]
MTEDSAVTELMDSDPYYNAEGGSAFHGNSKELLKELPDNSIDLIVTSPPFALQHQKEYGNEDQEGYNDWFMEFIPEVRRVLQPHGSFVVEIGGAFKRGWPERSPYQFELLNRLVDEDEGQMHLAQDFYWYNPAKLPNPIEWVNVRKIRVTDAVTHIWWLTPEINKESAVEEGEHPHPEANNQRVLQEYSDSQKELMETGEYNDGKRSSGWNIDSESFANENEGSIPDNFLAGADAEAILNRLDEVSAEEFLEWIMGSDEFEDASAGDLLRRLGMGGRTADNVIEASNTASNTHYLSMCRKFGFDSHPARFPRQIPEFFIDYLTPNPPYDDWDRSYLDRPVVLDIFGGSNLTGSIAQQKGRYWMAFEQEEKYLETSQFRFLTEDEIKKRLDEDQSDFGDFAEVGDD